MPYIGGSLRSLFDRKAQTLTREVAPKVARRGADRWHEVTAANTPVRTGNLRTSWYQLPVMEHPEATGIGHRTGVASDVDYAPYVEYGTGIYGPEHRPYVIVPKDPHGVLAWRDPKTGQWVFAKKVNHPGSPGNHMVAIGAHIVEGELEAGVLAEPVLAEWAHAIEGLAD